MTGQPACDKCGMWLGAAREESRELGRCLSCRYRHGPPVIKCDVCNVTLDMEFTKRRGRCAECIREHDTFSSGSEP